MSKKREKILLEISKTKEKIAEYQEKLNELEQQKTELENTEIVALVRSTKMNTTELAEFLKTYRGKSGASFLQPKQEETINEE